MAFAWVDKKKKLILPLIISLFAVLIAIFAVLFLTAKPIMLYGYSKSANDDKYISFYNFNGMSFYPSSIFMARNFQQTDDCDKISQMALEVNCDIEKAIVDYLDNRYSSYNVDAEITQNNRNKTVISFSGTSDENEDISVDMTIDWQKVALCGDDYIELT
ncbi:MAG: hypothetical protein ACI4I2_05475 [Oscillospiraceae bacterium]